MHSTIFPALVAGAFAWQISAPAGAQTLAVAHSGGSETYEISAVISTFKHYEIVTHSTWTGRHSPRYRGVRLSDVLAHHDLTGEAIEVGAENGYVSKIPFHMIEKYQPILAFEANGAALDYFSRGPLSLIWPRSDYPTELGETTDGMWTWYVNSIALDH